MAFLQLYYPKIRQYDYVKLILSCSVFVNRFFCDQGRQIKNSQAFFIQIVFAQQKLKIKYLLNLPYKNFEL